MKYRLWDTSVGRLLGTYANEEEPLDIVLVFAESYGDGYAENLTLAPEGAKEGSESGERLLARARAAASEKERDSRPAEAIGSRRPSGGYNAGLPLAADRYSCGPSRSARRVTAPARDRRRG